MQTLKPTKREREIGGEIRSMFRVARSAERDGSYAAAVKARQQVSVLRAELARLQEERLSVEEDPLERVARLRSAASAAGSYTAATQLAKLEAGLLDAKAKAARASDEALAAASDEEVLDLVVEAIRALPDTLVVKVRDACEERIEAGHLRLVDGDG